MRPWAPGFGVRAVGRPSQASRRTVTDQPTDGGGKGHGRGRQERSCRPLPPPLTCRSGCLLDVAVALVTLVFLVVAGVLRDAAPGGLEDPTVQGRAEPLDLGAEQPDQDRGQQRPGLGGADDDPPVHAGRRRRHRYPNGTPKERQRHQACLPWSTRPALRRHFRVHRSALQPKCQYN